MKIIGYIVALLLLVPHPAHAQGPINATGIIGQADYNTNLPNGGGSISGGTFGGIGSLALDPVGHRLFVSDYINKRILEFPLDSANHLIPGAAATHVLGACSLSVKGTGRVTATTFTGANIVYSTVSKFLYASIGGQNRVLGFNAAPSVITNCEPASIVFGQPVFTTSTCNAPNQTTMCIPDDIAIDDEDGLLLVSEEGNSRVSAWSTANLTSASNGQPAVFELGQVDFVHAQQLTAPTQSNLTYPFGVSWDGSDRWIFVSDGNEARALVFFVPNNPTSAINGEPASYVLGEPDFTTLAPRQTQMGVGFPDDNSYDPVHQTFCITGSYQRDTCFDVRPAVITNGMPAFGILDQNSWTSSVSGTTQSVLTAPEWPHAFDPVNNVGFIYEKFLYRVLQFSFIHIATASLPEFVTGVAYSQPISITQRQGASQTYTVIGGALPTGMTLDPATGVISGTNVDGIGQPFTIEVDDNFQAGYFLDRATYTLNPSECAP